METVKLLQERLKGHVTELAGAMEKDVARFNDMLRRQSAGQVVTKVPATGADRLQLPVTSCQFKEPSVPLFRQPAPLN